MDNQITIILAVKGREFYLRANLWVVSLLALLYAVLAGNLELEAFLLRLIKLL